MENIFVEKLFKKCDRETFPRHISGSIVLHRSFLLYIKLMAIGTFWNYKLQTTCFYSIQSFFKKDKKRSATSLPALFSEKKKKKIFLLVYSINWSNFILWLSLLCEQYIVIVCWPASVDTNFEIKLILFIKPFFVHNQKVKTKI